MRLNKIDARQTIGWGFASFIFGLCLVAVFFSIGPGGSRNGGIYGPLDLIVFLGVWIFGIFAIRLYIQDKDPLDFNSLLGLGAKLDKDKRNRKDDL